MSGEGTPQGAASGPGHPSPTEPLTGLGPTGGSPSRKWRRLTEAEGLALWLQGGEAIGALRSRAAWGRKTGYDSEGTSGLLEMVATGLETEPPAQAMEAHRAETRQRLGAKPDSAIDEASGEVDAPYNTLDHLLSLNTEITRLTTALAESERKRVEDRRRIEALEWALRPFAAAVFDDNRDVTLSTGHIRDADYRHADQVLRATPTQETPNAQG